MVPAPRGGRLHLSYLIRKLFDRMDWAVDDMSYHGLEELQTASAGIAGGIGTFEWRGADVLWGRKPIHQPDAFPASPEKQSAPIR